jgi:hypothetical protein
VALNVQVLNQINYLVQHLNFQQFNTFVNSNVGTQEENINVPSTEATDISQNEELKSVNDENSILIPMSLKYEEVLDYFMQLTKLPKHEHLKSKDIVNLVKANFKFKNISPTPTKRHLAVNIDKQYLTQFVYRLYNSKDRDYYKEKATLYCQFMIDNFIKYKDDSLAYLKKNFARGYKGPYPFKS